MSDIPPGLDDFELTSFFSFSAGELGRIAARRQPLHRLALALHIGFLRMTGRKLDVFERIPKRLWTHLGQQIGVASPELATLRSLYTTRAQTLYDHQQVACDVLGFREMTEHQRRYVVRWLRETLPGRGGIVGLLPELKRWFYEHQILLIANRELKRFIAEAVRDREAMLLDAVMTAYGPERLTEWADAITSERSDGTPMQTWLWAAPRKQSTGR